MGASLTPRSAVVLPMRRASRPTRATIFDDFETWLRSWGAAELTVTRRISALEHGATSWTHPPAEVTTLDLQRWLASPAFSAWTRVTYYNHVRSFCTFLVDSSLRDDDPSVRMRRPAQPGSLPKPLSPHEIAAITGRATGDALAFFTLARRQGLRAHEIAKVRAEDVSDRTLFVTGKGRKEAFLPLHPDVRDLAERYPTSGWWFPRSTALGHVSGPVVSTTTRRLFRAAGVSGSIHRGRHTYATELLRAGVNIRVVQELMRHSSLATTEAYLAATSDELRAAVALLVA